MRKQMDMWLLKDMPICLISGMILITKALIVFIKKRDLQKSQGEKGRWSCENYYNCRAAASGLSG